jgi:hypothetical protein
MPTPLSAKVWVCVAVGTLPLPVFGEQRGTLDALPDKADAIVVEET